MLCTECRVATGAANVLLACVCRGPDVPWLPLRGTRSSEAGVRGRGFWCVHTRPEKSMDWSAWVHGYKAGCGMLTCEN
jgi:hypothetical protein